MVCHVIDPIYTSPAAVFIADRVRALTGYDTVPDPDLLHPIQIDHKAGCIHVRPGMSLAEFHSFVGRAGLYLINKLWIPEFRVVKRHEPNVNDSATNGGHAPHCSPQLLGQG